MEVLETDLQILNIIEDTYDECDAANGSCTATSTYTVEVSGGYGRMSYGWEVSGNVEIVKNGAHLQVTTDSEVSEEFTITVSVTDDEATMSRIETFTHHRETGPVAFAIEYDLTQDLIVADGYRFVKNTANGIDGRLENADGTAYIPTTEQYPMGASPQIDLAEGKRINTQQTAPTDMQWDIIGAYGVESESFDAYWLHYGADLTADLHFADENGDFTLLAENTGLQYTPPTGHYMIYEGTIGLPLTPSAVIAMSNNDLLTGDTATITFEFNTTPADLTTDDITVPNCSKGALIQDSTDPKKYTMIVTAGAGVGLADVVTLGTMWHDGYGNNPTAPFVSEAYAVNAADPEMLDEAGFDAQGSWNTPYPSTSISNSKAYISSSSANGHKIEQYVTLAPSTTYVFKVYASETTNGIRLYLRDAAGFQDTITFTTVGEHGLTFTTGATLAGSERVVIYAHTGGSTLVCEWASLKELV